jgi:superfamily II DNA or RNA helicase
MCQLICDQPILDMVRNKFSVHNDAKRHCKNPLTKQYIPDRKFAITPTGLFKTGLYLEISKFLLDSQINDLEFTETFKNRIDMGISNSFWNALRFDERYFQKESIQRALEVGYGVFLIATGGGKSFCQALLIENFKRSIGNRKFKCLVVVPGLSLVSQLNGDFIDYGVTFDFSFWTGDNDLQDTEVVICNSEILNRRFTENQWVVDVDLLIVDECHRINSDAGISKIIQKIKTPHKFGFTGTLPSKHLDEWEVIGTFGPVLYEKKSKQLRDEGFLSNVEVLSLCLKHKFVPKMSYKDELDFLYNNSDRNKFITKLASKMKNNTLILVNHLAQMDRIYESLSGLEKFTVRKVTGETPVEEREKLRKDMEEKNDIICVAMSSIFSTGINIKNIHNIFFVALGKSSIRTIQSIGRGLRLHEDKERLVIYDINDNCRYSSSHSDEREIIYDKEQIKVIKRNIEL